MARLVARGFQEESVVDSPTSSRESICLALSLLAHFRWDPHSIGVKTAFLQSRPLDSSFYPFPPKADFRYLWKLKNCLYGLADAARKWFDRLVQVLLEMNWV